MSKQPAPIGAQGHSPESRRWHFANAVLDDRTFELTVDGAEVEIERKPFEVLRFLLQHAGEVVTKDELLAGVWPGRFLSETVLTKCVGRLREVLGDDGQTLIKTVYGYGYRFMAPVRIELQRAPEAAHFDFKEGEHPRERPLWSLVRRLGSGGHGEAWLARHDKTRDQRVFKFAIDEPSLAALKREITLFRFLNDSLGERARVVPLLDWNLEHPPCFIEMEYVASGSLVEWAERSGGLSKVPLATRIEIAAQIAEALAAVHSVGVLHKDLKPSNVLVEADADAPRIRLADFGSGGVLDPKKLEALGITRLGFTKTIATLGTSGGGTLMYAAPELLGGQPPTVKADIYALGVMLYQLVVGEFRKAMAAGWEHEIGDEVLRECIAQSAHGESALRLADAAELALRLRGLEQEREKRRRDRETRERVVAAERALERLRARRTGLVIAFGVLVVGIISSTLLYLEARKARDQATHAAATSRAVADFLSKDLFAQVGAKPLRDFTVTELLESASKSLDQRGKDLPEVSAQLHAALGNATLAVERYDLAEKHLDQALTSFEASGDAGSEAALVVASQLLSSLKARISQLPEILPRYEAIIAQGQERLGKMSPRLLDLREQIATARFWGGDWKRAADDLRALIADRQQAGSPSHVIGSAQARLGFMLVYLGPFSAAAEAIAEGLGRLRADASSHPLERLEAEHLLAVALINLEQFSAARQQLSTARELARQWLVDDSASAMLSIRAWSGALELRQGNTDEAISILENTIATMAQLDWVKQFDPTAEYRSWLAEAYSRSGRRADANREMQKALQIALKTFGPRHPATQHIVIGLADILRTDDTSEARRLLATIDASVIASLGVDPPYAADLDRVQGLLALGDGDREKARKDLREALRIYAKLYGDQHGYTRRARDELSQAEHS